MRRSIWNILAKCVKCCPEGKIWDEHKKECVCPDSRTEYEQHEFAEPKQAEGDNYPQQ
jgi:hypothetical protein